MRGGRPFRLLCSGISGDMTLGALIDAGVDANAVRAGIDSLGLPVKLDVQKIPQGWRFAATFVQVSRPPKNTSIAI